MARKKAEQKKEQIAQEKLADFGLGLGIEDMDVAAAVNQVRELLQQVDGLQAVIPEPMNYEVRTADGGAETIVIEEQVLAKRRAFDRLVVEQAQEPSLVGQFPRGIQADDPDALSKLFGLDDDKMVRMVVLACDNRANVRDRGPLVTAEWVQENLTQTDMSNILNYYAKVYMAGLVQRIRSLVFSGAVRRVLTPEADGLASVTGKSSSVH